MSRIDTLRLRVDRMVKQVDQRLAYLKNMLLQSYEVVLTDEQGTITYRTPEHELMLLPIGVARKVYGFDPNDDGSEP